jgi:hypothetical protein
LTPFVKSASHSSAASSRTRPSPRRPKSQLSGIGSGRLRPYRGLQMLIAINDAAATVTSAERAHRMRPIRRPGTTACPPGATVPAIRSSPRAATLTRDILWSRWTFAAAIKIFIRLTRQWCAASRPCLPYQVPGDERPCCSSSLLNIGFPGRLLLVVAGATTPFDIRLRKRLPRSRYHKIVAKLCPFQGAEQARRIDGRCRLLARCRTEIRLKPPQDASLPLVRDKSWQGEPHP